ncbi:hypothetical protein [Microbulbifer yueqingensis]|nr:hypothetical protein [Microbulbifer yueqingensis]
MWLLLVIPAASRGVSADPLYALFEFTITGAAGSVRTVEIVIVDGDRKMCEDLLAGIKEGYADRLKESDAEVTVRPGRQDCRTELPAEFGAITTGVGLKDAYYVSRKLELTNETHKFFSVLYGLDTTNANNTCLGLIKAYARNRKFSDLMCMGPPSSVKKTTTRQIWPPEEGAGEP